VIKSLRQNTQICVARTGSDIIFSLGSISVHFLGTSCRISGLFFEIVLPAARQNCQPLIWPIVSRRESP
jgi:hypothetical protein